MVHTPHGAAHKEWLGNAAVHGRMATVFAQLIVAGERHGVHALLVPIREPDGAACRGVRLEDSGIKEGLAAGLKAYTTWFAQQAITDALECDLGWYLMSGAVETPKAKAIRGIPDELLAAPIAFDALPTAND